MIEKKKTEAKDTKRTWLPYAIGSAVFAALTSILGKIGITDVESNLGTAIRTGVVLVMAWLIVFVKGKGAELKNTDSPQAHHGSVTITPYRTASSALSYRSISSALSFPSLFPISYSKKS